MKIHYRRRSLSTMLGITRAKKRINRPVGLTAIRKPLRAPGNFERRLKRRAGYYSEPIKLFRWLTRLLKR